jgi:hypothetical protein
MGKTLAKQDFLIKDLAISIGAGGRGGTWMPGPDTETPPTPISPIASVLATSALIEAVRGTVLEAVKNKRFDEVAAAFAGDAAGNAAIRVAIHDIGAAVVASAAYAGLGGAVGLVNPECGGTSFETIPPTITPIVHYGAGIHRVTELPRLKAQLAKSMAYLDRAATAQQPNGAAEVGAVRGALDQATAALR